MLDLTTQFRCSGCKDYTDWVDQAMGYSSISSMAWKRLGLYDFQVFDSMSDVQQTLDYLKNDDYKCRLAAGFC